MIYDKTRALEPGYYDQFEMVYKPALEKDRKDAERYRWLRELNFNHQYGVTNGDMTEVLTGEELDAALNEAMRTAEPLLVAPPVTKGKAELQEEFNQAVTAILEKANPYINTLNQVVDDYDLTSNDTRRGD